MASAAPDQWSHGSLDSEGISRVDVERLPSLRPILEDLWSPPGPVLGAITACGCVDLDLCCDFEMAGLV